MARDGVTNIVIRLQEHGFDPRRVGSDAWEARCPAHQSLDHALAITRNEFDHVVLECRSVLNCPHTRIIGALGFTNDHVYAETPEWLVTRLDRMQIQPMPLESASADQAGASEMTPRDQEDVVALPVASAESNASGESHVPPTSDRTSADSIVSSSAVDVMVVGAEVFDSTSSWQAPVMVERECGCNA
jgi:hypothetical protein